MWLEICSNMKAAKIFQAMLPSVYGAYILLSTNISGTLGLYERM